MGRPMTTDECVLLENPTARYDCLDKKIIGDTFSNAFLGGFFGAAIGGGIGFALGGPHGAARGALAGGLGGGSTAALLTYYIEHRDANALEDIRAYNRQLARYVEFYKMEAARANRTTAENRAFNERIDKSVAALQIRLDLFDRATRKAGVHTPEVEAEETQNKEDTDKLVSLKQG
jgi:hypothetical protein